MGLLPRLLRGGVRNAQHLRRADRPHPPEQPVALIWRQAPVIILLRLLFTVIFLSMVWVTSWASHLCPLFAVPRAVSTHPWFIATMFDAYWGFTTFFVWVCFKQLSWTARISWFLAIMALGNIAMSSYCLS